MRIPMLSLKFSHNQQFLGKWRKTIIFLFILFSPAEAAAQEQQTKHNPQVKAVKIEVSFVWNKVLITITNLIISAPFCSLEDTITIIMNTIKFLSLTLSAGVFLYFFHHYHHCHENWHHAQYKWVSKKSFHMIVS